ncbi:MAG: GAF domain-containing protein [Chloroflexi bacterium]|nr:GAF domain-containing protein [Chloroflexota bacterium]
MVQDQRAVLELLYRVSREFATALDLKTVLTRVLFSAIKNVGGERGSVVVMDDYGRAVDSAIVYGNQLRESNTMQLKATVDHGLAGWVVRNRQAALVPDTSKDSRWLLREDDAMDRSGAKSAICVPLMTREKLVGVLTLVHPVPGSYNVDHLDLMQAIADQAGIAVLNARLFSESQRQARAMTALAEGAASLSSSVRMDDLFENILTQTKQALQVEITALGLVEDQELVFRAASQYGDVVIGKRLKLNEGIAGTVAFQGHGVIIPAAASDTQPLLSQTEIIPGVKVRALACAPIQVQGKVIGVLEAINPVNKSFDPDALFVLTGLGALAGTTIQNAQLFESLDAARKRYRDLFEDSIDPIIITDLKGRILEVNKQAVFFSGHSAAALHEFLIAQVHDINYEKTGRLFEKIGDSGLIYESTLYDSRGGTYPVEVYSRKVIFDETKSIQWILRDLTERKELDSLREDLAAMIYHDLRSPLANILSSVEMLDMILSEPERENAAPIMKIAHDSINRIQRLVSSLLDLNRLEQNQPVGERQSVEAALLVTDAVDAVGPSAAAREQTIITLVAENLSPLWVDIDMIRRVLINLLENAVKYTPMGGRVEIGAEVDGDYVRFFVLDNGQGIPETERDRIFDKFARLKNKTGAKGLGVGLAFCKLAVQGHGGKIWVEPAAERGSKFLFTVPMVNKK